MPKFKKGSLAAKRHMARLRAMRNKSKRSSSPTRRRVRTMAKRRVKTRIRTRTVVRRSRSTMPNKNQFMIGMGLAAVTEPFVDQLAARFAGASGFGGVADDAIKVLGGFWLAKKTKGTAKAYGMSMALLGIRNFANVFAGGFLSRGAGSPATSRIGAGL